MTNKNQKPEVLSYTRCAVPSPLSLAIQLGWIEKEFEADGIVIKAIQESNKPSELNSHFNHHLPDSFRQGGSVPPIWAKANGADTKVIGLSWTDEFQAIVSLSHTGLSSVKDLRGRKVGIPLHQNSVDHNRASAIRAFQVALELDGLSLDDIEMVDLPDSAYITVNDVTNPGGWGNAKHSYVSEVYALVRGEVDAVYVKDVRGAEVAHLLGAKILFDIGSHPDPYIRVSNCAPRPLTINAETVENHPDIVARLLRKVVQAGEWAKKNPAETVTLIARDTGWSESWVGKVFGPNLHQHLGLDLAEESIEGIDTFKNFLFENAFIPADFDTRQWVDPRPMKAILSNVRRIA